MQLGAVCAVLPCRTDKAELTIMTVCPDIITLAHKSCTAVSDSVLRNKGRRRRQRSKEGGAETGVQFRKQILPNKLELQLAAHRKSFSTVNRSSLWEETSKSCKSTGLSSRIGRCSSTAADEVVTTVCEEEHLDRRCECAEE